MTTPDVYLRDLAEKLYRFQQDNVLCDTVLIADDCQVWAHSIVLAAVSPYVYNRFLLITGHKAKYRFSLKLSGCEASCVRAILHFLYTGSLVLPTNFQHPETFAGILLVCEKLGINVSKLNGTAVKFVDDDVYANLVESKNEEFAVNESLHQASSDSCLGEVEEHDDATSHRSPELDALNEGEILCLVKQEPSVRLESVCSGDMKLEMDVYEPTNQIADSSEAGDQTANADHDEVLQSVLASIESKAHRPSGRSKRVQSKVSSCNITSARKDFGKEEEDEAVNNTSASRKVLGARFLDSPLLDDDDSVSKCSGRVGPYPGENKDFACPVCGRSLVCQSDLQEHSKECKSHFPMTCKDCGKTLMTRKQLRVHIKLHSSRRLHICQTCGKAYRYRSGLVIHSYKHTGQLPYLCDICGAGFKDFFSMGQHKKRRHSTFRPFVCQMCGKGFIRNVLLLRHMRSHSGEKQHICQVCGMAFGYSANLTRHLKSHGGDKPHSCNICGKSFSRLDHLHGHALTHKGERNHSCAECHKVFKSAILLKRHETIHSDDNLHTCNVCGKRFTALVRLKQHMVKHEEKQYKCHICKKTFSFERFLLRHLQKCHVDSLSVQS